MDTKPVFNNLKHVMSVFMCISSTKKTKIFEVPNKLKSQSFESIVSSQNIAYFLSCGMADDAKNCYICMWIMRGKRPINSEIRIGPRIMTTGDEHRRTFLGPYFDRNSEV
jgi:hypothetical protein